MVDASKHSIYLQIHPNSRFEGSHTSTDIDSPVLRASRNLNLPCQLGSASFSDLDTATMQNVSQVYSLISKVPYGSVDRARAFAR